jgi:hypothetical protein
LSLSCAYITYPGYFIVFLTSLRALFSFPIDIKKDFVLVGGGIGQHGFSGVTEIHDLSSKASIRISNEELKLDSPVATVLNGDPLICGEYAFLTRSLTES